MLNESKHDDDTTSLKSLSLRKNNSIRTKNNFSTSPKSTKTNRSNPDPF